MKITPLAASILLATTVPVHAQSVAERGGNIVYTARDGTPRALTSNGNNSEPVLSPDRRLVAYVHADVKAPADETSLAKDVTSLWIADLSTGKTRKLIGPSVGRTYEQWIRSFAGPIFSPDGRSIYVSALAAEVTCLVHRIDVATGKDRYVIDGCAQMVMRTGPYRGALLVRRHKYRREGGADNPIDIALPDGKAVMTVPGTKWWNADSDKALERWLRRKGWTAS